MVEALCNNTFFLSPLGLMFCNFPFHLFLPLIMFQSLYIFSLHFLSWFLFLIYSVEERDRETDSPPRVSMLQSTSSPSHPGSQTHTPAPGVLQDASGHEASTFPCGPRTAEHYVSAMPAAGPYTLFLRS